MKSTLLVAAFGFCGAVLAVPPACMLNAVKYVLIPLQAFPSFTSVENTRELYNVLTVYSKEPNPAAMDTICGKKADKVMDKIHDSCGGQEKAALKAFSSACKDAGKKVCTFPA